MNLKYLILIILVVLVTALYIAIPNLLTAIVFIFYLGFFMFFSMTGESCDKDTS